MTNILQFIREWFYLCHNVNLHSNRTSKSKIYITTSIIGRPVCIILNVYMYISNMYERSKIWHTKLLVFNKQKLNTGFFFSFRGIFGGVLYTWWRSIRISGTKHPCWPQWFFIPIRSGRSGYWTTGCRVRIRTGTNWELGVWWWKSDKRGLVSVWLKI